MRWQFKQDCSVRSHVRGHLRNVTPRKHPASGSAARRIHTQALFTGANTGSESRSCASEHKRRLRTVHQGCRPMSFYNQSPTNNGIRCCRTAFQTTTTHFSFRKRRIHSIASPLANERQQKIAETGRCRDTRDTCSFAYPACAPDGLHPPFPVRSGPISIRHSSVRTIPQKEISHTIPKGFVNIPPNTD